MLDFIIQVATLALKYPPHVHTNCCDSKYKTLCLNEHKRSCITKQWRLFIFQTNACQKVVTGTLLFRCYVILILFRSWILLRSCLYLLYWLSEDIRFDVVINIVRNQRHFLNMCSFYEMKWIIYFVSLFVFTWKVTCPAGIQDWICSYPSTSLILN